MESLLEWSGYKAKPEYEDVLNTLLRDLQQLREHYEDTSGEPVKFWPTSSYD